MPRPLSVVPQLFETMVRFFTPLRWMASIRFSGLPHRPNPPDMITAPSCMSRMASSALPTTLFIEPPKPGSVGTRSRANPGSIAFDDQGDALAAADAERGEAALLVKVLHRVEQRNEQAAARRADGMTEDYRSAADVHLVGRDPDELVGGHRHHRERLVDLPQVDVLRLQIGARQRLLDGVGRGDGELDRIARGVPEVADPGEHRAAFLLRPLGAHQDDGRGAVVDGGGVRRRYGAVLLEGGLERWDLVGLGELRSLVLADEGLVALPVHDLHRGDLGLERAFRLGLLRAAGGFHRELVLGGAREALVGGAFLAA